jgi:hypothetical protein
MIAASSAATAASQTWNHGGTKGTKALCASLVNFVPVVFDLLAGFAGGAE